MWSARYNVKVITTNGKTYKDYFEILEAKHKNEEVAELEWCVEIYNTVTNESIMLVDYNGNGKYSESFEDGETQFDINTTQDIFHKGICPKFSDLMLSARLICRAWNAGFKPMTVHMEV